MIIECRMCSKPYKVKKSYIDLPGKVRPICTRCALRVREENMAREAKAGKNGRFKQECTLCFKMKEHIEFVKRGPTQRFTCLVCSRRNRRLTDLHRRTPVWEFIKSHKEGKPCAQCNLEWPHYVLEFDHVTPKNKKYTVGEMVNSHWRKHQWHIISAEIAKCEVVCRNCHVVRTHERGHHGPPRKCDQDIPNYDLESVTAQAFALLD